MAASPHPRAPSLQTDPALLKLLNDLSVRMNAIDRRTAETQAMVQRANAEHQKLLVELIPELLRSLPVPLEPPPQDKLNAMPKFSRRLSGELPLQRPRTIPHKLTWINRSLGRTGTTSRSSLELRSRDSGADHNGRPIRFGGVLPGVRPPQPMGGSHHN